VRTAKLTNSKKTKKSKSSRRTRLAGTVFLYVDAGSSGSRINFAEDSSC